MNIGDIVVCVIACSTSLNRKPLLGGEMFKIQGGGSDEYSYIIDEWDGKGNYQISNFRLATQREIEAYNQGIRNINDILKIHIDDLIGKKAAVLITDINQIKAIVSKYNDTRTLVSWKDSYAAKVERDGSFAFWLNNPNHLSYSRKGFAIENGFTIHNFEDIDFESKFVLPKRWYVIATNKQQDKLVVDWCNSINHIRYPIQYVMDEFIDCLPNYAYNEKGEYICLKYSKIPVSGLTEITFEQFEKYVLNKKEETKVEQPKPDIKILGEKIEFIKKSIQFGDITLTLNDLEAIKRVNTLVRDQGIKLTFNSIGKTCIKAPVGFEGIGRQMRLDDKVLETIIKTLNEEKK